MADETTSSGGAPAANTEDPVKQIKSEFSRKTDNIASQLQAQQAKIDQIMNAVIAQQQAMSRPHQEEREIDPIDDPKAFARKIKEDAKREAMQEVQQYSQSQAQQNAQQQQVLNSLVQDYPELNDRSSDLFMKAQEIQATMSESERYSPTAIRAAVREAAGEVGLLPMKKRTNKNNDDFTVSSESSSRSTTKSRSKETELAPETLAFAEAIGMNINDPKYLEKLKAAASRKSWGRFK
jgi:hypothetical protein